MEYGADVTSAKRLEPSILNCTPAMPTLSDAFAETPTDVPESGDPLAGAAIDTLGAVESLLTVTVIAVEVVRLPAASLATAVRMCEPFAVAVVFQVTEY